MKGTILSTVFYTEFSLSISMDENGAGLSLSDVLFHSGKLPVLLNSKDLLLSYNLGF